MLSSHRLFALGLAAASLVVDQQRGGYIPARFVDGQIPQNQIRAVGPGEELQELTVDERGRVIDVRSLRVTPPFDDAMRIAIKNWAFVPAEEEQDPPPPGHARPYMKKVRSRVLVAAVFRAPTLNAPTLGTPPRDIARPSDAIAFPLSMTMPPFPPLAMFDGVVMLEVFVLPNGQMTGAKVVRSGAGFDQAALEEVNHWTFRPARLHGTLTGTYAYVVFGFRQPLP